MRIKFNLEFIFLFDDIKLILKPVLGLTTSSHPDAYGEILYYCPHCDFHKPKLTINMITLKWKCWVCRTLGISILYLYKLKNRLLSLKVRTLLSEYKRKIKKYFKIELETDLYKNTVSSSISLPKLFISLKNLNLHSILYKFAINFLKKRNITNSDIYLFNIGYCETGIYSKRIIIPSYDNNDNLNYFIARSYNSYNKLKYKNPKKLSVIIFLNRINWELPVTLCLGIFDAITINYNSIPLLGSGINQSLMKSLIKFNPKIYLMMDGDAQHKVDKIIDQLHSYGINRVYNITILSLVDDANSLGHKKSWQIIQKFNKVVYSPLDIFKNKLLKNLKKGK